MKSRVLAAVFAVVLTAGILTGCGSTKTTDTAKTEDTKKEETSSDKEVTQVPVSEEEAEADGFSDGTDGETTLDTSKELTSCRDRYQGLWKHRGRAGCRYSPDHSDKLREACTGRIL